MRHGIGKDNLDHRFSPLVEGLALIAAVRLAPAPAPAPPVVRVVVILAPAYRIARGIQRLGWPGLAFLARRVVSLTGNATPARMLQEQGQAPVRVQIRGHPAQLRLAQGPLAAPAVQTAPAILAAQAAPVAPVVRVALAVLVRQAEGQALEAARQPQLDTDLHFLF